MGVIAFPPDHDGPQNSCVLVGQGHHSLLPPTALTAGAAELQQQSKEPLSRARLSGTENALGE